MAEKKRLEFSQPLTTNIPLLLPGAEQKEFKTKLAILKMLPYNQFTRKEGTNLDLQQCLEIYSTFQVKDFTKSNIRITLFPFSLAGKEKQWFHSLSAPNITSCDVIVVAFLEKYSPPRKTRIVYNRVNQFQQTTDESLTKAWDIFHEYTAACPHHGFAKWQLLQKFYET